MKNKNLAGAALIAVIALMGFAASSASATTLEIGKVTQNGQVTFTLSVESGSKIVQKDTAGFSKNECSTSHVHGTTTSPYTGFSVTGDFNTMTYESCTRPVTVHTAGKFEVIHIPSTTNGTVYVEETVTTFGSAVGTLTCSSGPTRHFGTLTGVASGHATLDVNAVMDCGIIPSAKLEGAYTVTTPTGLGVSA